MELKITVILASLSHDEKKEIAKEILLKALNEVTDSQRTIEEKEKGVFGKVRDSMYGSDLDKFSTPEMLRTHYKYKELMASTKSTKELAVEEIIKAAVDNFKELSTEMVQGDEKLKELWIASSAQIQEDFPKYIHSAMTYYFASKLSEMQQGIQSALFETQRKSFDIQNIKARIGMEHAQTRPVSITDAASPCYKDRMPQPQAGTSTRWIALRGLLRNYGRTSPTHSSRYMTSGPLILGSTSAS